MRYREGYWREDVEAFNIYLDIDADKQVKEHENREGKKLSPSRLRKIEDKVKGIALNNQQKQEKFNNILYSEIEQLRKQFTADADKGFDNYATGFGLIMEKYIDAKNTSDLLMLCEAYNQGLLDNLIAEIKKSGEEKENEVEPEKNEESFYQLPEGI